MAKGVNPGKDWCEMSKILFSDLFIDVSVAKLQLCGMCLEKRCRTQSSACTYHLHFGWRTTCQVSAYGIPSEKAGTQRTERGV